MPEWHERGASLTHAGAARDTITMAEVAALPLVVPSAPHSLRALGTTGPWRRVAAPRAEARAGSILP